MDGKQEEEDYVHESKEEFTEQTRNTSMMPVLLELSETAPAEFELARTANHMAATTVLENQHLAFGALLGIV